MISVIIPALNEEQYIEKALEALDTQDYSDFEVIVVDNGSTDKTQELVKKFSKVSLLEEKRKGTMWACEKGRGVAKGEIIVRMDADCLPETDWLTRGAKHFEDDRVSAVSGPYYYYDAGVFSAKVSLFLQIIVYIPVNFIIRLFKKGGIMIGGNSFFRARFLATARGFDTSIVFYGDDVSTAKTMSNYGKVVFDKNISMKTSARRLKSEGAIKITLKYIFHFLKVTLE